MGEYTYPIYVREVKSKIRSVNDELSTRFNLEVKVNSGMGKNILFLMMNPGSADEFQSDNTVNRILKFVSENMYDENISKISVGNLYPFYESDSSNLIDTIKNAKSELGMKYEEIIMENNNEVTQMIELADFIVVACGEYPKKFPKASYDRQVQLIYREIKKYHKEKSIYVFKTLKSPVLTKSGYPRHPCMNKLINLIEFRLEKEFGESEYMLREV